MFNLRLYKSDKRIGYETWWNGNEPYENVYLKYKALSKVMTIHNKEISLKYSDRTNEATDVIKLCASQSSKKHETAELPYSIYQFEAFLDEACTGTPIWSGRIKHCPSIKIKKSEVPYEKSSKYALLKISSNYKIPTICLKICLRDVPEQTFNVPEMEREGDSFATYCLIHKGASEHIGIWISEDLREFCEMND